MPSRPQAIYDARPLGFPKITILSLQHLFAMFGATILVPTMVGLPVASTLFFAGMGTLIFHWITKGKVPAFLSSSCSFVAVYLLTKEIGISRGHTPDEALAYACLAIAAASMLYFVIALLIRWLGVERILKIFPPVLSSPIIIAIGLTLAGTAVIGCKTNGNIAIVALLIALAISLFGRGMVRLMPVFLGVVGAYLVSVAFGLVNFTPVGEAAWVGLPFTLEQTVLPLFNHMDWDLLLTAILIAVPIILASVMEHIGDIFALSSTSHRNFLAEPGLHRTLCGDGAATMVASLFGAPANTTYSQNTGALTLTRVFDPLVVRGTAIMAILLSFCPKVSAVIQVMPEAVLGGVCLLLFGTISSVGISNLVENKVNMSDIRNVAIVSLVLTLAVGVKYGSADQLDVLGIPVSGMAVATLCGIVLNLCVLFEDKKKAKNTPQPPSQDTV